MLTFGIGAENVGVYLSLLYLHKQTSLVLCVRCEAASESHLDRRGVRCAVNLSAVCVEEQVRIDVLLFFLGQTDIDAGGDTGISTCILPSGYESSTTS